MVLAYSDQDVKFYADAKGEHSLVALHATVTWDGADKFAYLPNGVVDNQLWWEKLSSQPVDWEIIGVFMANSAQGNGVDFNAEWYIPDRDTGVGLFINRTLYLGAITCDDGESATIYPPFPIPITVRGQAPTVGAGSPMMLLYTDAIIPTAAGTTNVVVLLRRR